MAPRQSIRRPAGSRPPPYVPPYALTPPSTSNTSTQPVTATNKSPSEQIQEAVQWLESHTFETYDAFFRAGKYTESLVKSIMDRALGVEDLEGRPFGTSAMEKYVGDWLIWILWDLAGRGNAQALDEANTIIGLHSLADPESEQTASASSDWVSNNAIIAAFIAAQSSPAPSASRGHPTKKKFSKVATTSTSAQGVPSRKKASSKTATSSAITQRVRQPKNAPCKTADSTTVGKRIRTTAGLIDRTTGLTTDPDRGKFPMMRRRRGGIVAAPE